ncbi:terminal uridylyltransferase 4-like [Centruroides vittatus]|uniref:terminal uridylyltransferase 4-like n=1 Tax=Centruroides vittatus TaxID=120091 RepID=UPI003510C1FB
MMFSDENQCQKIENHLKSLLLMGSKTTDSSLARETTVYENSYYPHENERSGFRAERRNNTVFRNDHIQNIQRTENKKQRRKFQSDFVDLQDRRSNAETRRLFSGGQNAFTGEQKHEHFNSNHNNKRHHQRNHRKRSNVKSEHNQCNSFYSTEFLSRVSDKDVHTLAENDVDFEPELFYPKYSPKSKESNKKSRNYFKSDNVPRTFVPQKSQPASFKDNSDQGVRTDSVNLVKERRTQANIFRNALVKTRCNETKKEDELQILPVNSKDSLTENAIPCKNDLPSEINTVTADDQASCSPTKTSSPKVISDAQCKNETTNQSAKMPDLSVKGKLDLPSPNFLKVKAKYEALKANPQDNFITSCTKPNCNCSANVIYCTLCDFHIENEKELIKHKKNVSHQLRREDFYRVQYLKELPPPTETQFQKMEELFDKIYKHYSQEYEDVNIRFSVVDKLKFVLKDVTKECEIHLFGSSVNGFGLKDSNLNIDLAVPQGISPSSVLLNTYDIIKEREDKYINVWKDFTAVVPKITFLDRQTNLTCEITLNNEFSGKTSRLFAHYAYCDERVRKLGIIFRFWAKVCEIDQQQICSLPSYCYPLMVIFFLQQHDPPVIPVLHELTDFDGADSGNVFQKTPWKSVNNQSVAQLWMELLKFYGTKFLFKHHVISICQSKPLLCTEKKWTTRMMCIEDPYHKKRNVARSIANHQWFHYIVECIRSTYEYFITCRSPSDQSLIENEVFEDDEDEDDEDDDEDIDFVSSDDICEKFEEEQDNALNTDTVKTILSRLNLGNNAEDALKYRNHGSSDLHDNSNLHTLNTSENNQSTFLYKFDVSNFITLKKPTLYCRQCQKTGHYKQVGFLFCLVI